MKPTSLPPQAEMMRFILGKWISKPINVVCRLNIADILSSGPKGIEEIARITGANAPILYRIMRALACLGIFAETDDGSFEMTPLAACLRSDALGPISLMMHADWHDRAWDHLYESVKTGEAAFDAVHGMSAFEWFDANPQAAEVYHQANAIKAATCQGAIIDAYDFSGIGTMADIGGGTAALMLEILKANSTMNGVVADRSAIIRVARHVIRERGLASRCHAVACDFFKAVPTGSDAYLLSNILHDWDDAACHRILRTCYAAMKPGTKLLIVEAVIPPGNEFSIAKLLDIEVLVMGGGRERTENEFRQLLKTAGFDLHRVIPTDDSASIIEGIRKL